MAYVQSKARGPGGQGSGPDTDTHASHALRLGGFISRSRQKFWVPSMRLGPWEGTVCREAGRAVGGGSQCTRPGLRACHMLAASVEANYPRLRSLPTRMWSHLLNLEVPLAISCGMRVQSDHSSKLILAASGTVQQLSAAESIAKNATGMGLGFCVC